MTELETISIRVPCDGFLVRGDTGSGQESGQGVEQGLQKTPVRGTRWPQELLEHQEIRIREQQKSTLRHMMQKWGLKKAACKLAISSIQLQLYSYKERLSLQAMKNEARQAILERDGLVKQVEELQVAAAESAERAESLRSELVCQRAGARLIMNDQKEQIGALKKSALLGLVSFWREMAKAGLEKARLDRVESLPS